MKLTDKPANNGKKKATETSRLCGLFSERMKNSTANPIAGDHIGHSPLMQIFPPIRIIPH